MEPPENCIPNLQSKVTKKEQVTIFCQEDFE
jgi:hypothetical protein